TSQANKVMLEADISRRKRKQAIDKLAATLILQSYLDRKRP
ncbi:MAG TPA: Holliday junction resolvase RuvX, partial [Bacilli bacterium]|nr:Holliday junction resolvase RuvX [Bacilli bacterium]